MTNAHVSTRDQINKFHFRAKADPILSTIKPHNIALGIEITVPDSMITFTWVSVNPIVFIPYNTANEDAVVTATM